MQMNSLATPCTSNWPQRLAANPDDPEPSASQVDGLAFSVGSRMYRPSFLVPLQAEKAAPMKKKAAVAPKKRAATKKMEGPAKRAKKAAPKK